MRPAGLAVKTTVKRLLRPRFYYDAIFHRVTARDLHVFFTRLGVQPGMLVYLQSSYGALGHFSGGPRGLLELLIRILGPEGTLVLPTFPSARSMVDIAASRATFDVRETPAGIGLLPEIFRKTPGVVRSIHPTHPVCAVGAMAEEIVAGHERCLTPQGPDSPFAKLYERGAHVLRIGTRANPLAHTMQEMADWPNLFMPGEPATFDCLDRNGKHVTVTTRLYRPRVPYILFLEDPVNGEPVEVKINDFPIVTHAAMRTGHAKGRALNVLLEMRAGFEVAGVLRAAALPHSEEFCDLYPLLPVMDFSVAEARRVISKFRDHYDLSALQQRFSA
jgi:aminoglycoside N3'-acetyltransferase